MIRSTDFERNLELLHKSLSVASLRDRVYADNIANVETPNFKRTSVSFEAELKTALQECSSPRARLALRKTTERHIDAKAPVHYSQIQPHRVLDFLTTSRNNGNNVDIDIEVHKALENQMTYTLLTQITGHLFRQVDIVLR